MGGAQCRAVKGNCGGGEANGLVEHSWRGLAVDHRTKPVRVRVRCFIVTGGMGAAYTTVLRKEEVEELHLGCGWKGWCAVCGQ